MSKCVSYGDSVSRVESQEFPHKIQEVAIESIATLNNFLYKVDDQYTVTVHRKEAERTCSGFVAFTSFLLCRDDLEVGQASLAPSLKNSGLLRAPERANLSGIRPITASIMARCSRLSCVWNKAWPVWNSTRIQPSEKASHGNDQPKPDARG